MNTRFKRMTAVVLTAGMLASALSLGAGATDQKPSVTKEETVYVITDAGGAAGVHRLRLAPEPQRQGFHSRPLQPEGHPGGPGRRGAVGSGSGQSFSGLADGAEGSVTFLFRTGSITP